MLTDAPHSTHSGRGAVDTKNEIGSYIEDGGRDMYDYGNWIKTDRSFGTVPYTGGSIVPP